MLYIIRHGKTDWNEQYKLQGGTDIPLNDTGRAMAREAKKLCDEIPFDICYSSPLIRARETAELLLEGRDVPIIVDDRIREMSFGDFEGIDHVYQKKDSPMYPFFMDPVNYVAINGAETFESLYKRTGEFLKEMVYPKLEDGKNILIVGHGAMNNCIYSQVKDIPLERYWENSIKNCQLIKLI